MGKDIRDPKGSALRDFLHLDADQLVYVLTLPFPTISAEDLEMTANGISYFHCTCLAVFASMKDFVPSCGSLEGPKSQKFHENLRGTKPAAWGTPVPWSQEDACVQGEPWMHGRFSPH